MHRAQAFIERHLDEPITLQALARAAGCSPWHLSRIFREVTGKTPFEYVRAFRLSQAAQRLVAEDARVVDVALDFLFDSHDGFTRAFSRRFGMTPSRFRKLRPPARLFLPPSARTLELTRTKGAQYMPTATTNSSPRTVFIQIIERPARKLIVKRGTTATEYFQYCREVGCDVWDVLSSVEAATHEPMGLWLPPAMRPAGTSEYVQGVEVPADYAGPVPAGYELMDLPACTFMVFQGQPYQDEGYMEAIGELQSAIDRHDPQSSGYRWADDEGPRFQLIPLGYRGYIEGRPVRPLAQAPRAR